MHLPVKPTDSSLSYNKTKCPAGNHYYSIVYQRKKHLKGILTANESIHDSYKIVFIYLDIIPKLRLG